MTSVLKGHVLAIAPSAFLYNSLNVTLAFATAHAATTAMPMPSSLPADPTSTVESMELAKTSSSERKQIPCTCMSGVHQGLHGNAGFLHPPSNQEEAANALLVCIASTVSHSCAPVCLSHQQPPTGVQAYTVLRTL